MKRWLGIGFIAAICLGAALCWADQNVKQIPTNDLKAYVYDLTVQMENLKQQMNLANQEIALRQTPKPEDVKKETKNDPVKKSPAAP